MFQARREFMYSLPYTYRVPKNNVRSNITVVLKWHSTLQLDFDTEMW